MKFCNVCENMYYISINSEDENKLIYYCKNCGNKDSTIEDVVCVLNTDLKKKKQTFSHLINKYTKLDPTLPRIYNMECPNPSCPTKDEGVEEKKGESSDEISFGKNEIIYMRYDDDNMKYLYICTTCDTMWKTDDI